MDVNKRLVVSKIEAMDQGLVRYFTGIPCRNGHVSERFVKSGNCVTCNAEKSSRYRSRHPEKANERVKDWVNRNRDHVKQKNKENYVKNKDDIKEKSIRYYNENKDRVLKYKKEYSIKNREKINQKRRERVSKNREKYRKISRDWQRKNKLIEFKKRFFRHVITTMLRRTGKAISRTNYDTLYTESELRARIEFQFKGGMSWDNYGEWHIDHKKPISRFISQGIYDLRLINALSNLQPLWAKDNISKGAKFKL